MKYSELKRLLKSKYGAKFIRHGRNHDIWESANKSQFSVPRHDGHEIPPGTLNSIIKKAQN